MYCTIALFPTHTFLFRQKSVSLLLKVNKHILLQYTTAHQQAIEHSVKEGKIHQAIEVNSIIG